MKLPILLITSTLLFSATLVTSPIIPAEKMAVQAQEANLNSVQAYLERGIVYSEQGKHELAIADFNQALKIDPDNVYAYGIRGASYAAQGKYELAIADFNQVIKIDPDNVYAYGIRGASYAAQGKYEFMN
jgi:tetratricopeptide (TPR) repeat protein